MLFNAKFLVCAAFVAIASASPTFNDLVVHEQRNGPPSGFVSKGAARADKVLNLRIALVQRDMSGLEERLYDVSTPGSPHYGQHLSKEEVRFSPSPYRSLLFQ